jgi:hypothetical protein
VLVRVRDHLALSTAGAVLVSPWARSRALGLWAGSVLIDADHYVWFCLHHRLLNPAAAVRYFHQAHAAQHSATRVLHTRGALLGAFVLALCRPGLLAVAAGMGLHVALDAHHEARMNVARLIALQRDGSCCRGCGARGPGVGTHLERQPWLFPSYGPENLVSLCGLCHEIAHARLGGAGAWS